MNDINRREFLETTLAMVPALSLSPTDEPNGKVIKFSARVLTTDTPNKNNRIYSKEVIQKAIKDFEKLTKNRSFMGQLGMTYDAKVNFSMVSHIVTDLNNELLADIEVLSTPCGKKLQEMLKNDGSVDLRTQGIGIPKYNEEDGTTTVEDYKLIAINAVEAGTGA